MGIGAGHLVEVPVRELLRVASLHRRRIGVSLPTGNLLLQVHAREVCALYACEGDDASWSANARPGR
jgi:hypothetical protein